MTIELAPELEARLREIAGRRGLSVEEYLATLATGDVKLGERGSDSSAYKLLQPDQLAALARSELKDIAENEPILTIPAEILKYWEQTGVFENAPEGPDSPELARQWREKADEERRTRLFGEH